MAGLVEVILDRSGSMALVVDDTIKGWNEFVDAQPRGTRFGMTQFDTRGEPGTFEQRISMERVLDRVTAKHAKLTRKNFVPRGLTPLYDAVGSELTSMLEDPPKGKVAVVIITDGEENASHDYTLEMVRSLIARVQAMNWQIVFLGADIDAYGAASKLGIGRNQTMSYVGSDTRSAYSSLSQATATYMSGVDDQMLLEDPK